MTAPVPPVRIEDLAGWLRRHRWAFTDDALRDRLLAAGHASRDVDAAFALLEASPTGARPPGRVVGAYPPLAAGDRDAWPPPPEAPAPMPTTKATGDDGVTAFVTFLGAVAMILGIPYLLLSSGGGSGNLGVAVYAIALLTALVGWGIARDSGRPGLARGLGCGLLVGLLPLVAVIALWGYCLVSGWQLRGP